MKRKVQELELAMYHAAYAYEQAQVSTVFCLLLAQPLLSTFVHVRRGLGQVAASCQQSVDSYAR